MKQKILLTGATGTVGKEVLIQLIAKDLYDISVFIQKSRRVNMRVGFK